MKVFRANWRAGSGALALATALCLDGDPVAAKACKDASRLADNLIGAEVGARARLQDGDEFALPLSDVLDHGRRLFGANWTVQEGGGRPYTTGTGRPLADDDDPLHFPRNFNRVSAPDANSCAGCHNVPSSGGGGDHVTKVFVLGQRFDFATFDEADDDIPLKGSVDEAGYPATLQTIANARATLGMFGSGYLEMVARQMTERLQQLRDGLACGESVKLRTNGVSFGTLSRTPAGAGCAFDVRKVEGLPTPSLAGAEPSLVVRPFHQVGAVVSLREFTNNAYNHHHGIQSVERFGEDADPDGDGFCNEMTGAEVTAVSAWQATLQPPGRRIPDDRAIENAVLLGEDLFRDTGCARCHKPFLKLQGDGWIYTEPNPFNPPGNLQVGDADMFEIDLRSDDLPGYRLEPDDDGVIRVPAYTDLKLHDITSGPDDPNCEPLDQTGTDTDTEGNCLFLTKKLWGGANEPPYYHHGKYTTMREAILAHDGEAKRERRAFERLNGCQQDSLIEFLKTLQVLPATVEAAVVDEKLAAKDWPPSDRAARLGAARVACAAG